MITAKEVSGGSTVEQATYTYDYFGNLIQEALTTVGGTTVENHAIDQWNPANTKAEVWADINATATPTITTQYVRGDQTNQIFATISSGSTLQWLLADKLGSTRFVLASTGNTVNASLTYDAWGNIKSGTATVEYLWAGMLKDSTTGLYYDCAGSTTRQLGGGRRKILWDSPRVIAICRGMSAMDRQMRRIRVGMKWSPCAHQLFLDSPQAGLNMATKIRAYYGKVFATGAGKSLVFMDEELRVPWRSQVRRGIRDINTTLRQRRDCRVVLI